MSCEKFKKVCRENFWALLNIFAQESDFISGERRRQIHQAASRQDKQEHQSTKNS